ncbi:MAG: formate/nitrite transporter family protein, partial [Candidatus Eiseniibacteriota bacterium]
MDYMKPKDVANAMVEAGTAKAALAPRDLLVRGMLSGAILGFATSLAIGATVQTGQPIVGAIIFPVGFVMIVLLGLELVTGSFALIPLPFIERKISGTAVLVNWSWVFLGNLIGA